MKLSEQMHPSWWIKLQPFFKSEDWRIITDELALEIDLGKTITPRMEDVFRAFKECSFDDLKIMMLGQDPYPTPRTADGLAFSARYNKTGQPKSLQFITEAIEQECYGGFDVNLRAITDLTPWANQGVLLINAALTTIEGKVGVHYVIWEPFINFVLDVINQYKNGSINIFFGRKAQDFDNRIDKNYHYKLYATHPASAAYTGQVWVSNNVFQKSNEILHKNNNMQIEWNRTT